MKINRETWMQDALAKIRTKMEWVAEKNKYKIPYTSDESGNYDDSASDDCLHVEGLYWWTNGFWSGLMWLLYHDTKKDLYLEAARYTEHMLEKCFEGFYLLHHDVGFMYMMSAVADYRLTGNEDSRRVGIHAANLLAGRFNPVGRFLRAWNDWENDDTRGWAIIDCMMNLSILYWAYEESKDPRFKHIATMHADTTLKAFIRGDGSVNHIVEFDPETGDMIKSHGGQGVKEGSSWTRGHAWAIYGFVISYLHTKNQEYLDGAKRVAHYCIANIPEDGIIPIDFRQPEEPAYEDSCGACIMASGLLELSECVAPSEKNLYRNVAVKILKALYEKRTNFGEDCDAIVQNCSAAYHGDAHHMTMNYADYFFVEAIYKLNEKNIFLW